MNMWVKSNGDGGAGREGEEDRSRVDSIRKLLIGLIIVRWGSARPG